MKYKPHKYQHSAIEHVLEHPFSALFLGLGLGKTSITATALEYLVMSTEVLKPLIVAPKLVAEQTWKAELEKWDHTRILKISRIIGNPQQRIAALYAKADVYVVSRDNIAWLVDYLRMNRKKWPFDCLVLDELSSFKNRGSMRFKALKKVLPFVKRTIGLTGTPAPNSLLDLWPQMFLLDKGERLGKTLTGYRDQFFVANYNGFGYTIREGVADTIHEKISDICISMTAEDYLDLPPRIDVVKYVELENQEAYEKFKKEETLELLNGEEITPLSAAALYSKLLQFSNGAVYSADKEYHIVDTTKLDAILEAYEALNGEPVIIFYQFKSDLERLKKAIPEGIIPKSEKEIDMWNRGEIKCLLAHPASIGHGLNLAEGGNNLFWMGLPWSLELYLQAVGRLDRQGQTKSVINMIFIAKGTLEEFVVAPRIEGKTITQNQLITALKKHVL